MSKHHLNSTTVLSNITRLEKNCLLQGLIKIVAKC
eukprot:UN07838